jgi:osmotically-inducible protein OsmY
MRSWLTGMVLVGVLAGPVFAAEPGARTTGAYTNGNTPSAGLTDTVTTNVRAVLEGDKLLKGAVITVATSEKGVVTLVGSVPNVTAKREAVESARGTPGVVEVQDMLRFDVSSPNAPAPQ